MRRRSEPITTIMGIPEMFIDTGSTINLTCIVSQSPNPPTNILWTHNGEVIEIEWLLWLTHILIHYALLNCRVAFKSFFFLSFFSRLQFKEINYDSPRGGVSVITEKGDVTTSYLLIQRAKSKDSGKYVCSPSNATPVSISVHVLNGNSIQWGRKSKLLVSPRK